MREEGGRGKEREEEYLSLRGPGSSKISAEVGNIVTSRKSLMSSGFFYFSISNRNMIYNNNI